MTPTELADAIAAALVQAANNSSANTNGVATLDLTVSDPPTQAEVQAIVARFNEALLAQRR